MLITASYLFLTTRSPEGFYQGWIPKPDWVASVVWAGNLPVQTWSQHLNQLGYFLNSTSMSSIFWLGVASLKNYRQYEKVQNASYIPKTRDNKILFIPHFYLLSMNTSTLVEPNHLETFQVLGNAEIILISAFPASGSKCKDQIFLHPYFQVLNN